MQTKVLVVDDDVELTDLMKMMLEPKAFAVQAAHSGSEGIELARQYNPDVIILDLFMPEMDGWEVCREIRKFSQVPILMLSAISKPGMIARALDEGADDYLIKPMPTHVLIAHLNKLTRRSRAEKDLNPSKVNYYL